MFNTALRKFVLINAVGAFAVIVLLLVAAFFLIRTNLERSAYGNLEDVARAIAASDLHELFEEDDVEDKYDDLLEIDNPKFWIVSASGKVALSNNRSTKLSPLSSAGVLASVGGAVHKSVVTTENGDFRVVTVPERSSSPSYVVQVTEPDSVSPELIPIIRSLMIAGVVGLGFAVALGYFVARRTMRPIERAFELQRDFISGASHELRTPITVVQANADAVQRLVGGLSADDARLLEDIQLESEFLGQLVARLAELARLQDDFDIPLESVDLQLLCRDTARSMTLLAEKANMRMVTGESNESVLAIADRVMLRQVVLSLVENAFKYSGDGSTVELKSTGDGSECELVVRDDGVGIPAEHLEHVTERFYRVDKARSRSSGSSGLGLAMAREAITVMGGSLSVESAVGSGTTVRITLPAVSS